MPITGTNTNYTFRRADLALFPGLTDAGLIEQMSLGGRNPKVATGHLKATQNFLRALLTPLGHYRARPGYGSELYPTLLSGAPFYQDEIPNIFAIEAMRVVEYLFTNKPTGTPEDEIIDRAVLAGLTTPDRTRISMQVQVFFANDDEAVEVTIPISMQL